MEAEWTPQSVWMFQITEKSIAPAAIQNLYHPAPSPVTILTGHSGQNYKCSAENSYIFIAIYKILNTGIIIIIMFLHKYSSRIFNSSWTLGYLHTLTSTLVHTKTRTHIFSQKVQ